jgi:hypothetical protein
MIAELLEMSNRRQWPRVRCQLPVDLGSNEQGYTLNVSLRGARIVARRPVDSRFPLTLEVDDNLKLEVEAETVWQEALSAESRVVGVRFLPNLEQQKQLRDWMERSAKAC